MEDTRVPVWLDCDPGHDDTFAILFAAYHPAIRLLGISTVFGNASLDKTTWNARSILTAIGKHTSIAIYPGASHALVRPPMHAPTDIHGESGLDGTTLLPQPLVAATTSLPAIDAMAQALQATPPNTAWLVATGAMTNAAALFTKYPDLAGHIKGLSIMGGAVGGGFTDAVYGEVNGVKRIGNWTPFAEFNILVDPEAAAALFENEVLAAKMTMVPLDVTHLVLATEDVRLKLLGGEAKSATGEAKSTLRKMLVELLMFFAEKYKQIYDIDAGPPLHDPLAVAAVLTGVVGHEIPFYESDVRAGDDRRQRERYHVKVITEGTHEEAHAGAQTGRTVAKLLEPGVEGVRIPRGLDIPKFWGALVECVERADEANAKRGVF